MGQKKSVLNVTSRVSVQVDCGTVDAIRLSYRRRSWWGCRRRVVASFTFPREDWQQLSPEDMLRNSSAEVATVHVGKLRKKDGNTPVRVSCLAGGVPVFRTEMTLADLLARLKYTEGEDRAHLSFSLAGRRLEGTGADTHAFTVMFCNGKRLDNGGAEHLMGPPQQQHQTDHKSEPDNGLLKEVSPDRGVDTHGSQPSPLSKEDGEEKQVSPCHTNDGHGQETGPVMVQEGSPSQQTLLGTPEQSDVDKIPFGGELENHVEGGYFPGVEEEDEFLLQAHDDLKRPHPDDTRSPRKRQKTASKENRSPFLKQHDYSAEEVMEEDPLLHVDLVQEEAKGRKVRHRKDRRSSKSLRSPARRTRDSKILRGQGHVRGALWDRVAGCAGVVALVLTVYNAWVQYNKYW